jgi:hypothetical protein
VADAETEVVDNIRAAVDYKEPVFYTKDLLVQSFNL